LFRKDEYYYVGDYLTGRIYKTSPGNLAAIEIYELPGFEEGKDKLAGIYCDDDKIWVCYDGNAKIFQVRFSDMRKRNLL
jgi:hypothetical protein